FVIVRHIPFFGGNDALGQGGIGWINSYWGLIVPSAVGAFGIFMLRQFFQTLPVELEDAARIDGAGELRIFWQIMLPLAMPAVATLAIFSFQAGWNAFLWPLLITTTDDMRTVQLGLTVFVQQYSTQWDQLMAATVVATLPVILVFGIGQRLLVRGIAFSGLKGYIRFTPIGVRGTARTRRRWSANSAGRGSRTGALPGQRERADPCSRGERENRGPGWRPR